MIHRLANFETIERRGRAVVSEIRSVELDRRQHVRRDQRIVLQFVDDLERNSVRDVELTALERIGDVLSAFEIETEIQFVDVRDALDPVIAIAAQSHAFSFDRFFDHERAGAGRLQSESREIARLFDGNHPELVHREQRQEKCERLVESHIDRVIVVNDDAVQRFRSAGDDIISAGDIAQDPIAR